MYINEHLFQIRVLTIGFELRESTHYIQNYNLEDRIFNDKRRN